MAQQLTEELKVFVTAEVDKAIKALKNVDKQTKAAESSFKVLGKTITAAFVAKEIINFSKQSIEAWENQKQAVAVLNSTITATGANAWTSSKQLQEMASSLQKITNYGDETVIQMQSVLLGFKNIKGDTFEGATKAILDMATVMKMDLSSAAQAVGKALDDPINGITSLQRQGFRFSESQKAVIQSLIDTGDTAAAQKIILDELNSTYGGAAEAAVKGATQIKNAWGDLMEGVGGFLEGFFDNEKGKKLAEGILWVADAFGKFHENVAFLQDTDTNGEKAFSKYYNGLTEIEDKIKAAEVRTSAWSKEEDTLNKKLEEGHRLSEKKRDELEKELSYAKERVKYWDSVVVANYKTANMAIITAQKKAEELEATSAIEELMTNIASDYEKLSKDDPVIQLENYRKQLEKIAKDKETLSLNTTDVDASKAIEQLDYNTNVIRAKIKEIQAKLQDDGKKSWQQYFEDVTGVSQSSFTTGQQAGELYVKGLQEALNQSESLSELLGKKFDSKAAIENQMAELESTITNLLNIPADKINEAYSTADDSIRILIDEYKRLNEEKKQFEVTEALDELNEKTINLTKTERELFLIKLAQNNATEEQIKKANELFDKYEKAQEEAKKRNKDDNGDFTSWEDKLEQKLLSGIEKLHMFKENADEANKTIAALGTSLVALSFTSTISGAKELGKALGEGKNAGEAMQQALVHMAQEILNQLPTLFLQAGLQLIAQGQWALGLGLITSGVTSAAINGFTESKLEANALGGVYGDNSVLAFAKGGTFTNQIVNNPTFFKFARGGKIGTGLMGEAGPEAIMPLKRGADGSLGVEATIGGNTNVKVVLAVEINNYSKEQVQAQETTDERGNSKLMIMIGNMINTHISGGKADRALTNRYGLKVQGV